MPFFVSSISDGFLKSLKYASFVIPTNPGSKSGADAGIQ